MPRKSPAERRELPDLTAARQELGRRYLRAVVSLLVRIVALALFTTLLVAQLPVLRNFRAVFDLINGVLAIWPFFIAVARIYSQRIALGRRYYEAGQMEETASVLEPLDGWRGRFFDLSGEGAYLRAMALHALGRSEEASRILATLLDRPGIWGERARTGLGKFEGKRSSV